jgi:hypothetical protein
VNRQRAPRFLALALAPLALVATSCRQSTSVDGETTPVGLVVAVAGSTLIVVHGTTASEGFHVAAGQTTAVFTVTFTDGKGQPVVPADGYMGGEVESPNVATFEPTTPGAYTGQLQGKLVGLTRARFKLYRGTVGSGALIYTSPWITVVVEP